MADEELKIAPGTTLRVVAVGDQALELEARYDGAGTAPPAHLHPVQDEHFEILVGAMFVRLEGEERRVTAGETLVVPRGTAHQMWNAEESPARTRWVTTPAGRTLEWFRELAAAVGGEPLSDAETLLERYADTLRIVAL